MNVIHPWANVVGVLEALESIQQLHIGPGGFNGDDISVHPCDGFDDVVELGIAHMSVYLGVVLHAVGGNPEGFDGPVQVDLPVALAQG